ncbi:hypothetical protein HY945_05170, partial [Candidatus Gottesmanbacteria bacterium]|nr:hypothetical protein [Candidatus Gottesmanbacteria bacterium]
MELFLVLFTIILFVFLNSLTYILGALATPAGSVFLGTVHWTGDYFSYLSQFAQGATNWFFSYDLYTSDFPHPTLVGWVNVFLGRIFHLIGINHLMAYQLSIVIFAAAFLGVSYLLIREIFPPSSRHPEPRSISGRGILERFLDSPPSGGSLGMTVRSDGNVIKRVMAFVLFVTSNALPKIIWEGGKWSLSYYDFWFNNGLPFNRLGGVPHHLIARTAISLSLLLAIWWWKKKDWRILLTFPIIGFVLASVEPVHWGLVVVVLLLTTIFYFFVFPFTKYLLHKFQIQSTKSQINSKFKAPNPKQILKVLNFENYNFKFIWNLEFWIWDFIPSIFLFIAGLPMAIYLKNIVSHPPYSQLAVWEATQQLHINFLDFILGNGPVAILALAGFFLTRVSHFCHYPPRMVARRDSSEVKLPVNPSPSEESCGHLGGVLIEVR